MWIPAAWALELRVAPSAARSLVGLGFDGELRIAPCGDDAAAPDSAVDGVWTCALPDGLEAAAVLVDGRLWELPPAGPVVVAVEEGGRVRTSTDPATLPKRTAVPSPPRGVLVARLRGYADPGAPMLAIGGGAQLACHDDGHFPDRAMNDGEQTCIGVAAPVSELVVQGGSGHAVRVPPVTPGAGPVAWLQIDAAARTASAEPFELPWPNAVPVAAAPPPNSSGAAGPSGSPQGTPAGPPKLLTPVLGPWPWIAGIAGSVGVAAWIRRRERPVALPLRALAAPPALPGGPPAGAVARLLGEGFAPWLVEALVADARVVVVDVAVPPLRGVWVADDPDWRAVLAGVRALADTPGAPVTIVANAAALADPGDVAPDAVGKLARRLPPGVGLLLLGGDTAWIPAWRVRGPPWEAERAG